MAILSQSRSIPLTLTRLRRGVIACCWIVGLALAAQTLIWSLATYTQLRYKTIEEEQAAAPLIVDSAARAERRNRVYQQPDAPAHAELASPGAEAGSMSPISNVKPSVHDRRFAGMHDFAGGVGRLAMIVLVVAMGLGVMFSASGAVAGGERAVSAIIWTIVLALLVLPLGKPLHLPWEDGALTTYGTMTAWVDQYRSAESRPDRFDPARNRHDRALGAEASDAAAPSALLFHARFLLLPAVCIVGIALVGLRFSTAVEAAVQRDSGKVDPAIEREASNVSPTSLHGGRSTSVLTRAIGQSSDSAPMLGVPMMEEEPQVESPKRLI